jgi:hypothetical protein
MDTRPPLPPPIKVDIRPAAEGRLKVVWSTGDAMFAPYDIDRGMIERCAGRIRLKLAALVQASMSVPPEPLAPVLKELAKEGANLHAALFYGAEGHARPNSIRQWLMSLPDRHRLTFVVDGYLHVPWGLIFDGDAERLPSDDATVLSYEAFWCLKYLACCVYYRVQPLGSGDERRYADTRVLPIVHQAVFNQSVGHMPAEEAALLNVIVADAGGAIESSAALKEKWAALGRTNRILFFYCHADGNNLALSARDVLSTDFLKLQLRVDDLLPDHVAIGLLNGCSTAVGGDAGGFIEAMSREGFCGFIGTESEVPNIFALRFGNAFLSRFLGTGDHLIAVMDVLRRQHWPLSLLYGIYGYPLLRVTSPQSALGQGGLPSSLQNNFSTGPIGATAL